MARVVVRTRDEIPDEQYRKMVLIARLMAELGVDMDAYVRNRQKAGARFTGDAADDQIEDWIAATLFMARCGLRFPRREELPIELPPQVELAVPAL